jgi:hypothetical protein
MFTEHQHMTVNDSKRLQCAKQTTWVIAARRVILLSSKEAIQAGFSNFGRSIWGDNAVVCTATFTHSTTSLPHELRLASVFFACQGNKVAVCMADAAMFKHISVKSNQFRAFPAGANYLARVAVFALSHLEEEAPINRVLDTMMQILEYKHPLRQDIPSLLELLEELRLKGRKIPSHVWHLQASTRRC